jgi:biopolymer transport protein ExbD
MRKRPPLPGINMTPLIDVVFQMIIFFICTIELEKDIFDPAVTLAWARDAQAVEEQDPRTVTVNLRRDGSVVIAGTLLPNTATFRALMQNSVNRHGTGIPVVIRGDRDVSHAHVRALMDACKAVGIWRVSFAALKEQA